MPISSGCHFEGAANATLQGAAGVYTAGIMQIHTVVILHNQKTNRFHPMVLVRIPLPGLDFQDNFEERISLHQQGFFTSEAARAAILDQQELQEAKIMVLDPVPWDGDMSSLGVLVPSASMEA